MVTRGRLPWNGIFLSLEMYNVIYGVTWHSRQASRSHTLLCSIPVTTRQERPWYTWGHWGQRNFECLVWALTVSHKEARYACNKPARKAWAWAEHTMTTPHFWFHLMSEKLQIKSITCRTFKNTWSGVTTNVSKIPSSLKYTVMFSMHSVNYLRKNIYCSKR